MTAPHATRNPNPVHMLPPRAAKTATENPKNDFSSTPFWVGVGFSLLWAAIVVVALVSAGDARAFGGIPLINWAIGISATTAPIAFIWMIAAYIQRAADVQSVTEPLHRQLSMILDQQGVAEQRIKRFNQLLQNQMMLFKSATDLGQTQTSDLLKQLYDEKGQLVQLVQQAGDHARQATEVTESARRFEQMMDQKLERLRKLDDVLQQSGEHFSNRTETIRTQCVDLLQEMERLTSQFSAMMTKAEQDSVSVTDRLRASEIDLSNAGDRIAEKIRDASRQLAQEVEGVDTRTDMAKNALARARDVLAEESKHLEAVTEKLPTKIVGAEQILRQAVGQLAAAEQHAQGQAEKLQSQLRDFFDQLQRMQSQQDEKLSKHDADINIRRQQIESLMNQVQATMQIVGDTVERNADRLETQSTTAMERLRTASATMHGEANQMSTMLADLTGRYEGTAQRVAQMSSASTREFTQINDAFQRMIEQLSQTEQHSRVASIDLQERARGATSSIEEFQHKLTALRDQVMQVADHIAQRLAASSQDQQHTMMRLQEAVQSGTQNLTTLAASLAQSEANLVERAQQGEGALRETLQRLNERAGQTDQQFRLQVAALANMLNEAQAKLDDSRNHLQAITSQAAQPIEQLLQRMEMSTQQGGQTIANYIQQLEKETRALEADVARLQQTGTLITSSSQQSTQSAEQLIERLGALQQNQERLSTEGLTAAERFAQVLQANMASLGKQAATSAEQLQHASQTVATETQNLQQTARQGAVTLSQTSQAMQQDITQLRALTQKQTGDLIGDLGRLQQQLQAMGEQLKTRCDDAYAMLDRTIAHSQTAGQHITTEIAARTKQISEQTSLISNRYDTLNTTLAKTIENIEHAAGRFGQSSANTTQMAERTVKQLEGVVERTGRTSEHVAHMVGQGIAKLDEMGLGLQRQSAAVAEGAQQAVVSLNKAISSFSEQLTRLSEISTQSDQQVRVLTGTASAMGEHAASLRNELQRQHERTQEEMQQVVAGLQRTGQELQHVVATALLGAEQSSARFGDISQQVAQQMSVNTTQLQQQTREAEHALLQTQAQLEAAASHLTQQVSTLTSQQQTLTVANDNQQAELANWFKRLGEAHQQSASAAAHASQRLEEMLIQLTRMMAQCSEQAQMSAQQLRLATGGMGEQASSMLANAQAVEHQMRAMTVATQTLSEQATKSREQTLAETQRASEALAELVGQLDGSTERIRYLSEKSAEDIAKLADHAATAKATQSQFSEALRTQHTELASANENARRELQQLVGNMTDALRTLLTGQQEMQAANGKFTGIMESMQQGIVDLAETANSTEDRLVVRQQSLAAGLRDINSLVTDAQTRLQNTQALATHTTATLQEALEKIEKNTAWMVDATGLGRQQLQSELDQLKGLKDQAAVALASYRHDLESLMHKVSETSAMGTSQAERTQHQLAQTLNSLNTATGQMTQLQTLSAEAIKLVEDRMASLGRQVESTGQVLQQNHHIFGNLQTAQESLGQMMTQATQRVEQLCEHTRQVARQTLADVQNMVADLQHLPQAGGQQLASKAVLLREVAEQSGRLMEGFNTQIETMLSRLTSASEVMRQQDRSLNDEAQRALRQIETMTTQLTITRDIVGGMSEQMLQKLTTVNNETTKQLGSIERAADDASGRMQQAATTWQRHAQALADGTTTARGEILALNHTLDALHRKADLVRGDLQSQTQHIVSALAQILAQLEETGETIQQVSDPLVDRIEYNLKQIG